jgi:hypothetical protein
VCEGVPNTIDRNNWHLTLDSSWHEECCKVDFCATQARTNATVVVTTEPFEDSFDAFAILTIRGVRDQGMTLVKTQSLVMNDMPFVSLSTMNNDTKINTLLTVKEGIGYSVSCGGSNNLQDCDVIKTFKVDDAAQLLERVHAGQEQDAAEQEQEQGQAGQEQGTAGQEQEQGQGQE